MKYFQIHDPEDIKVGWPYLYFQHVSKHGCFHPQVVHASDIPWKLNHGQYFCNVKGVSGAIPIKRLFWLTSESIVLAKPLGLLLSQEELYYLILEAQKHYPDE